MTTHLPAPVISHMETPPIFHIFLQKSMAFLSAMWTVDRLGSTIFMTEPTVPPRRVPVCWPCPGPRALDPNNQSLIPSSRDFRVTEWILGYFGLAYCWFFSEQKKIYCCSVGNHSWDFSGKNLGKIGLQLPFRVVPELWKSMEIARLAAMITQFLSRLDPPKIPVTRIVLNSYWP